AGAAAAGAGGAAGATSSGAAGVTAASGGAGGAASCDGCKLEVVYTCLGTGTDSRNFAVEVKNQGSSLVLYKELTLRYWYTADASKEQELDCDTAERLTCNYIVKSTDPPPAPQPKFVPVTPPRTKANEYVELAVVQGALDVGGTTGRIQLRLHNKDFSPIDQTADYSYDCGSVGQAHDSPKITAYIRGVLVAGTEPP
ncbi:MAG TPA: cellulose binding domain-containing protein, partial [Polyangia bacterium]|nr:cellulose binding domain-containing protein [Polyangia bacterium]